MISLFTLLFIFISTIYCQDCYAIESKFSSIETDKEVAELKNYYESWIQQKLKIKTFDAEGYYLSLTKELALDKQSVSKILRYEIPKFIADNSNIDDLSQLNIMLINLIRKYSTNDNIVINDNEGWMKFETLVDGINRKQVNTTIKGNRSTYVQNLNKEIQYYESAKLANVSPAKSNFLFFDNNYLFRIPFIKNLEGDWKREAMNDGNIVYSIKLTETGSFSEFIIDSESGMLISQFVNVPTVNFCKEEYTGIYLQFEEVLFPMLSAIIEYDIKGQCKDLRIIILKSCKLNHPIDNNRFNVALPESTRIVNASDENKYESNGKTRYRVINTDKYVEDLNKHSDSEEYKKVLKAKESASKLKNTPINTPSRVSYFTLILYANIMLAAIIIVIYYALSLNSEQKS